VKGDTVYYVHIYYVKAIMDPSGEEIKIVRGKYLKTYSKGWVNRAMGNDGFTPYKVYCILLMKDRSTKNVLLDKRTICLLSDRSEPNSFEEAVLDQHPKINDQMNKLAALMARCGIYDDTSVIAEIFEAKIHEAYNEIVEKEGDMFKSINTEWYVEEEVDEKDL